LLTSVQKWNVSSTATSFYADNALLTAVFGRGCLHDTRLRRASVAGFSNWTVYTAPLRVTGEIVDDLQDASAEAIQRLRFILV
jgi:hypothetical protein